jgi:FtsP/CotA-like multicopper oxidase with cupredoxin domain
VRFDVVALSGDRYRVAGMADPTIVVEPGANVHIDFLNEDLASAHGFVVVPQGAASSWAPMSNAKPAFLRSALWFLGDSRPIGAHEGYMNFTASTPGDYQYLDPVPGHALAGMAGTFVVARRVT